MHFSNRRSMYDTARYAVLTAVALLYGVRFSGVRALRLEVDGQIRQSCCAASAKYFDFKTTELQLNDAAICIRCLSYKVEAISVNSVAIFKAEDMRFDAARAIVTVSTVEVVCCRVNVGVASNAEQSVVHILIPPSYVRTTRTHACTFQVTHHRCTSSVTHVHMRSASVVHGTECNVFTVHSLHQAWTESVQQFWLSSWRQYPQLPSTCRVVPVIHSACDGAGCLEMSMRHVKYLRIRGSPAHAPDAPRCRHGC